MLIFYSQKLGASAIDSEKKIFQKRNNIIEREIYATQREARLREEDKIEVEKTHRRLGKKNNANDIFARRILLFAYSSASESALVNLQKSKKSEN